HGGLENPLDAGAPDDAGQRKRYAVRGVERTDGDHRMLVAQDDLRDPGANHADAVLARTGAFDDGDIGEAHFLLDALPRDLGHRHSGDPRGGPEDYLRGS